MPNQFMRRLIRGEMGGAPVTLSGLIKALPGIIDFWPLTETSGTVAVDQIATARNGTYKNAPTLANLSFGGAIIPLFNEIN
jgi:hypothetical protein